MTEIFVSQIEDSDCVDWDNYVNASDLAEIYHLYPWRHVLEDAIGCTTYYLRTQNHSGQTTGILPLAHLKSWLFGSFLVSLPCLNYVGVLADDDESREALTDSATELATRLDADHVELRHRDRNFVNLPFRDDKVAMRLSLPQSSEDLWQEFKPKLRSQIRRPTKEGATCVEGGTELVNDFYAVFSRNMRDLGTPVQSKRLFTNICEKFPEAARLHVVYLSGKAVAAGMTIRYRNTMEIPSASSLREFNRYSTNMLLYWSVLQSAIRDGCSVFDFGRSSKDAGTFQFKKQWGAEPQQLYWYYSLLRGTEIPKLNPDNPKYQFATRLWRWVPVSVANIVGPRIVRHLP